jgi:hypothetical protein
VDLVGRLTHRPVRFAISRDRSAQSRNDSPLRGCSRARRVTSPSRNVRVDASGSCAATAHPCLRVIAMIRSDRATSSRLILRLM